MKRNDITNSSRRLRRCARQNKSARFTGEKISSPFITLQMGINIHVILTYDVNMKYLLDVTFKSLCPLLLINKDQSVFACGEVA